MPSRDCLRGDILASPNRRRVLEAVAANPGIGFRELVRACPLAAGTVRHHLTMLLRHELIVEQRLGHRIAFFHQRDEAWRGHVALREAALKELYAAVHTAPGSSQTTLVQTMAKRGWRRSTTVHRLQRLEDHGLLRSTREQHRRRSRRYWPTRLTVEAHGTPPLSCAAVLEPLRPAANLFRNPLPQPSFEAAP